MAHHSDIHAQAKINAMKAKVRDLEARLRAAEVERDAALFRMRELQEELDRRGV